LKSFLINYGNIPWDALKYMIAEANYGGRVTETFDKRLIKSIIEDFFTPDIRESNYKFRNLYEIPELSTVEDYKTYLIKLDTNLEVPELFGIHKNGDITSAKLNTKQFLESVLQTIPRSQSGTNESEDLEIERLINTLIGDLPDLFDLEEVMSLKPITRDNSLNTVLTQDTLRYNRLISIIKKTLTKIRNVIHGYEIMDYDVEQLINELLNNQVPKSWLSNNISYPTMKSLGF